MEIIAVVVFALLAAFSIIWLRYFRDGPVEWLWRCGTYWQLLPLKKSGVVRSRVAKEWWPGARMAAFAEYQ